MGFSGGFIPGWAHTMAHIQQQCDRVGTISLFLALVGTANAFLPYGRQGAMMMVREGKKLFGFKAADIDVDQVVDRAEQVMQQKRQQSEDSVGDSEQLSPQLPRDMKKEFDKQFEEDIPEEVHDQAWARLGKNVGQQQQQQQQHELGQAISSSTAVVGQPVFVQQEKQKYEKKTIAQLVAEQQNKTALAVTQAGKRAQIGVDPFQTAAGDPWTPEQQLQEENQIFRAQLAHVDPAMASLKTPVGRTPVAHSIANPPIATNINRHITNFKVVDEAEEGRKIINTKNTRTITNGVLHNGAPSPGDSDPPVSPGVTGSLFQMGGQ